jgi:hypothetical protein
MFIFDKLANNEIFLPQVLLLLAYLHLNIVIHTEYLMVKGCKARISGVLGTVRELLVVSHIDFSEVAVKQVASHFILHWLLLMHYSIVVTL